MKIVVSSTNPIKIEAVRLGFRSVFPREKLDIIIVEVSSGVSAQPQNNFETLQGATNRAQRAKDKVKDADYWIGLEGGVEFFEAGTQSFAWIVVFSLDGIGKSRTASFTLPDSVNILLGQGMELGQAMDHLHKRKDIKKTEGAVGIITEGLITRTDLYTPSVILALKTICTL